MLSHGHWLGVWWKKSSELSWHLHFPWRPSPPTRPSSLFAGAQNGAFCGVLGLALARHSPESEWALSEARVGSVPAPGTVVGQQLVACGVPQASHLGYLLSSGWFVNLCMRAGIWEQRSCDRCFHQHIQYLNIILYLEHEIKTSYYFNTTPKE